MNKRERDSDSDSGTEKDEPSTPDSGKEKVDTPLPPKKRARKEQVGFISARDYAAQLRQKFDAMDARIRAIETDPIVIDLLYNN